MNANAAILDNDHLAAIEREEAAELAPEIVRDLNEMGDGDDLSPVQRAAKDALNDWAARNVRDTVVEPLLAIADKLPAELASISEMFSAMVERKAEIARKAAEDIAEVDAQMLRTLNQVLRRLSVEIELRDRERNINAKLQLAVDRFADFANDELNKLSLATDEAVAEGRLADQYERNYREQYEHAPEPPDDDGGSRSPVTRQQFMSGMDRDLDRAVDDLMESELAHVVASLRGAGHATPSLRDRVSLFGRVFLHPGSFIRPDASSQRAA